MAGFLGLCISLSAQEMRDFRSIPPDSFALNTRSGHGTADFFGTLSNAWNAPVPLTLADGRIFSFPNAFAWMEAPPVDFLPSVALAGPPRVPPATRLARDSSNKAVDLLPEFDYAGGEVGVFYGKSSGKFGREVEAGYILGEVVDGNTHITAGASYEHSSGRAPRIIGR